MDCPELIEEFLRNLAVSGETDQEGCQSLDHEFQPKQELTELDADTVSVFIYCPTLTFTPTGITALHSFKINITIPEYQYI